MPGLFIVLEGPDGSGTSLHTKLLVEKLQAEGQSVVSTAEPTEAPIGRHLRAILDNGDLPAADAVQLLFCADRAQHVNEVIRPALEQGQIVVCDRYILSTLIYGPVQGVDQAWLEQINAAFPQPDLTVITLPAFEVCRERIGRRENHDQFEEEALHRQVYDTYAAVNTPSTVAVDTDGDKAEVANSVWQHVAPLL